ncbi:MAG: Methylmalonyl-CoA decarboxylase [Thermodesulfobacteriota bacterium]|jgi:methylmalonyl-CoA decarboxylase|nr:Methylmalonyl-CoA decarboxylase [Thermodesulfobacteriota bacterium]
MENVLTPSESGALTNAQILKDIGIVTMNNPHKANCLSSELVSGIMAAFDMFEKSSVRTVILRAYPGAKVWSAGHDIKEIPLDNQDPLTWNVPFEKLLRRVRCYGSPVIGMIEGSVWGGACDLAMTCDLLVGTHSASFAITPAKIGLSYNTSGLTHFLGVLPLHIVKEMLFTAKPLSSEDAYRFGLLNRLVEPDQLETITYQLADDIANMAPKVIRVLKRELRALTSGPSLSPYDFEEIQNLRREAYRSKDFKDGISAFFEKRTPQFKDE